MVNSERAIASLEQQAKFWEERAAKMREHVTNMLNELREAERGGRAIGLPRGPGRPPSVGGRARAPRGQGVGAVTAQILAEWKRPARVNDLLPELEKRGARVGGKRPSATLNSTLLKFSGVKRVARGLFAHETWNGDVATAVAALGGAPAKRGPGRPRKVAPAAAAPAGAAAPAAPAVKRGPGRPRKVAAAAPAAMAAEAPAKRGPGRPPKRGPGRPPKAAKKGKRGRRAKIMKMPKLPKLPKVAEPKAAPSPEPAAAPAPPPAQG